MIPAPDPERLLHKGKLLHAILALVIAAFLPSMAHASSERVQALGGSSEMLLDNSNAFIYPASAVEWPHFAVSLFENWGGVLYPLGDQQVVGLFFHRPTSELSALNNYIQSTGSDEFRQLELAPLLDLTYARALRSSLALGTALSFAYDQRDIGDAISSARSLDLRLGLRLGTPESRVLDLSLGILTRRLKDGSSANLSRQTEGDGIQIAARYRHPIQSSFTLLPFASYQRDAFALAPQTRSKDSFRLGIGIELRPALNALVVAGAETELTRSETIVPGQLPLQDQSILAPAWVAAGQAQVGSLLFRLALRQENWFTHTQQLENGQISEQRHFDSALQTQVGLGMEFGPVLIDGLLERDFLRDGPHFIGGSRHGGGVFSQLGITYRFASKRG